jgi:peroxiredoxin
MKLLAFVAAALSVVSVVDAFAAIAPGNKIPSAKLHKGFLPEFIDIADYVKGRKVAVVGLPAAFTPVSSFL